MNETDPTKTQQEEKQNGAKAGPNQLNLGLRYSPLEPIYGIRRALAAIEQRFEVFSFWRNSIVWFSITAYLLFTAIIIYKITQEVEVIPPEIPLYYNHSQRSWILMHKNYLFIFPILSIAIPFTLTLVANKIYLKSKELSMMICMLSFTASLLFLVVFSQVFSNITV